MGSRGRHAAGSKQGACGKVLCGWFPALQDVKNYLSNPVAKVEHKKALIKKLATESGGWGAGESRERGEGVGKGGWRGRQQRKESISRVVRSASC